MQHLAMRAKHLHLAMNPALTASPPTMPESGDSATCRRGRVRPYVSPAPVPREVQQPVHSRARLAHAGPLPSEATLLQHA